MTRVLFLGDTHGDLDFLERAFGVAVDSNVDALFQVGDFGFLWPGHNKMTEVAGLSRDAGLPLFWIDGNHDWHPEIRRRYSAQDFVASETRGPGVRHVRRGSRVIIGNGGSAMTIVGLGGAPSIDRAGRVEGKSWWSEENITDDDVAIIPELGEGGHVDVLATHDAPARPPGFNKTSGLEFNRISERSHGRVLHALVNTNARLNVHGHWHYRYSGERRLGKQLIEGLGANHGPFPLSYLIVEKTGGTLKWGNE